MLKMGYLLNKGGVLCYLYNVIKKTYVKFINYERKSQTIYQRKLDKPRTYLSVNYRDFLPGVRKHLEGHRKHRQRKQ